MRRIAITLAAALAAAAPATASPRRHAPPRATLPEKTLPGRGDFMFGLAAGPSWSQEFAIAGRLASMAASGQEGGPHGEVGFRVAPLVEESATQALTDLMTSPTTDLAILPLPVMEAAAKAHPLARSRLGYVAPLYLETVHLVARAGVANPSDLAGKKVALGEAGSVGALLFKALGVAVEPVDTMDGAALDAVRKGQVDAAVVTSGGPVPGLSSIPADAGLHLVPIAYSQALEDGFVPARVAAADAPGLQGEGGTPTVAVQAVLAAYLHPARGERGQTLGSLVSGMLDHLGQAGDDPAGARLRYVNWAASLPGWTRLPAAQRWLDARERASSAKP